MSQQFVFELSVADSSGKISEENGLDIFISKSNIRKAERQVDVFILIDQILDSQENGSEGVSSDVLAEHGSSRNWDGVSIHASEALLKDRVLAN